MTLWVLLVVPLLALTVLVTVLSMPRVLATAAASLHRESAAMLDRFGSLDVVGGLAKLLAVVAVGLPAFGMLYMMFRTVRQLARTVLRAHRRPAGRAGRWPACWRSRCWPGCCSPGGRTATTGRSGPTSAAPSARCCRRPGRAARCRPGFPKAGSPRR